MAKKLFALVLLSLVITGAGGYYLIFKAEQLSIRREIKMKILQGLSPEKLEVFTENQGPGQFEWLEEGREFKTGGKIYDIVYTDTLNGKTRYHCINDRQEENLFANLDEMVGVQFGKLPVGQKSTSANLIKIISSLVYLPSETCTLCPPVSGFSLQQIVLIQYQFDFRSEIIKPPQFS